MRAKFEFFVLTQRGNSRNRYYLKLDKMDKNGLFGG